MSLKIDGEDDGERVERLVFVDVGGRRAVVRDAIPQALAADHQAGRLFRRNAAYTRRQHVLVPVDDNVT